MKGVLVVVVMHPRPSRPPKEAKLRWPDLGEREPTAETTPILGLCQAIRAGRSVSDEFQMLLPTL